MAGAETRLDDAGVALWLTDWKVEVPVAWTPRRVLAHPRHRVRHPSQGDRPMPSNPDRSPSNLDAADLAACRAP